MCNYRPPTTDGRTVILSRYTEPEVDQAILLQQPRGNLAGFDSIRVNSQWRLIFRWDGCRGEAEGVYLDDHSHRRGGPC